MTVFVDGEEREYQDVLDRMNGRIDLLTMEEINRKRIAFDELGRPMLPLQFPAPQEHINIYLRIAESKGYGHPFAW